MTIYAQFGDDLTIAAPDNIPNVDRGTIVATGPSGQRIELPVEPLGSGWGTRHLRCDEIGKWEVNIRVDVGNATYLTSDRLEIMPAPIPKKGKR